MSCDTIKQAVENQCHALLSAADNIETAGCIRQDRLRKGAISMVSPTMRNSVVTLKVRLQAAFRQEGGCWLARCLPLDVMTQAGNKEAAFRSLKRRLAFGSSPALNAGC
jgi:hypothetical protein